VLLQASYYEAFLNTKALEFFKDRRQEPGTGSGRRGCATPAAGPPDAIGVERLSAACWAPAGSIAEELEASTVLMIKDMNRFG
jgi:hypothetical protein